MTEYRIVSDGYKYYLQYQTKKWYGKRWVDVPKFQDLTFSSRQYIALCSYSKDELSRFALENPDITRYLAIQTSEILRAHEARSKRRADANRRAKSVEYIRIDT